MAREETTALDPGAVCTLPPRNLAERLAWVRGEILAHAVAEERGARQVAWELEDVPGLAGKLDRLVALESECCSGIVFEHRAAGPGRRRLEVRGVDPDAPLLASLRIGG